MGGCEWRWEVQKNLLIWSITNNSIGFDDFIYTYAFNAGLFGVALDDGTGKAGVWSYHAFDTDSGMYKCHDVRFGDLNGDGLTDCLCVESDGSLTAFLNDGGEDIPTDLQWSDLGVVMHAQGYSNDRIRLADIDGDGRVDYLGIDDSGNVQGWRNAGIEENGMPSWIPMGIINSGGTMGDIDGIRFVSWSNDTQAKERYAHSCAIG